MIRFDYTTFTCASPMRPTRNGRHLRDDCLELGVSFINGRAGTATKFETSNNQITAVWTLAGTIVQRDHFILAAGAWASSLVPFYNSALSTAQVVGNMRLTDEEIERY
ncbi:hypothetical protein ACJZ2D_011458 [Fusarium nematophilum]